MTRDSRQPGKPASMMRAEMQARQDVKPVVVSCLFCDWTFEGTVAEGREFALAHRLATHPGAVGKRRQGQTFRAVVQHEPKAGA